MREARGEISETTNPSRVDHPGGDEDVFHARRQHALRFTQLGDTDANGSPGKLLASDSWTLMGLAMRAQPGRLGAVKRLHAVQVAPERAEVDDEGWGG